jgi:hypothetical protein
LNVSALDHLFAAAVSQAASRSTFDSTGRILMGLAIQQQAMLGLNNVRFALGPPIATCGGARSHEILGPPICRRAV